MQKEIKTNAMKHGATAVLLAIILTVVCFNFGIVPGSPLGSQPTSLPLKTFSSLEDLKSFLSTNTDQMNTYGSMILYDRVGAPTESGALDTYSTTNVQVAGVDESDIVKTDGTHLYVVSGATVYILNAYPPSEAKVVSKINLDETYGAEIYISMNRLVIIGNSWPYLFREEVNSFIPYMGEVFVKVYDTSDLANPVLSRSVTINGTLTGSRMIGDYVYIVTSQPAVYPLMDQSDFEVSLPKICMNGSVQAVNATEVRYVDVLDYYYQFTTVLSLNIQDDSEEPNHETFLAGSASCMYVSSENLYLAIPNVAAWILADGENEVREETLIYRVNFEGRDMICEAQGAVLGSVLNQFSMDEYDGGFRIATTTWTSETSVSSLYILDMNLTVVGRLEDIAPGERIYSARFMSSRCYLVTFEQVDPFFVIDVSDPANPSILGYLKIPGFSGYLHPYDESHIIGLGCEDSSLKFSLFDVTDVSAPTEMAKYTVQGGWSDSSALWDHKAFLFDRSRRLLSIPVSIWTIENETYWRDYWQGAYIFDISLEQGFTPKGTVTHLDGADSYDWGYEVKRILFISDVLYTVSDSLVQMHDMESLGFLNELKLS